MNKIINTKNLIYLSLICLPLYLIRFKIFSIPTNVLELLILATLISFLSENKKLSLSLIYNQYKKYVLATVLILIGLIISTLVNQNYFQGLGIIKSWFIIPIFLVTPMLITLKNEEDWENTLKALYLSSLIVGIIGLIYFFRNDLTDDLRLKAFYLSPNHLAMFLAPAIVIGIRYLVLAFQNQKIKINNLKSLFINYKLLAIVAGIIVILSALYFTYSYATWIALILSLGIIILFNKRRALTASYWAIVTILLAIIVIFNFNSSKFQSFIKFDDRSSTISRIMIWKSAGKILKDNPIIGIGPGNFQNKYLEYQKYFPLYLEWAVPQPHNLYLAFWLQSGLMGMIGFLFLIFFWLREIFYHVRRQKNGSFSVLAVSLGIILYILIHGLVDTPYWKNDLSVLFWVAIILGILSARQLQADSI